MHFLYLIIPSLIGHLTVLLLDHITQRIQSDLSIVTSALRKHFDCYIVFIQIFNTCSLIASNISMEGYYCVLYSMPKYKSKGEEIKVKK